MHPELKEKEVEDVLAVVSTDQTILYYYLKDKGGISIALQTACMQVECLLARRLRAEKAPYLPAAEIDAFACVAIIDISGYTALTDRLAALDGIDRIKDVLNPPFELIISTVHQRLGSVVKLAGDSAIVLWNIPPQMREELQKKHHSITEAEKKGREIICTLALLAGMELLELFENYQVKLADVEKSGEFLSAGRAKSVNDLDPDRKSNFSLSTRQGHGSTFLSNTSVNNIKITAPNDESHYAPKTFGSATNIKKLPSKEVVSERTKDGHPIIQTLGIHIGMGFGEAHHLFVGSRLKRTVDNNRNIVNGRAEYFIAGKALQDAGIMLSRGATGQMLFCNQGFDYLDLWETIQQFKGCVSDGIVTLDTQKDFFPELKKFLNCLIPINNFYEWGEGTLPPKTILDRQLLTYIEPSLLKHLFSSIGSEENYGSIPYNTSALILSENSDQYRTITVVFLHFPQISVQSIGNSDRFLNDVQFVAEECIRAAGKNGGTCRQIHADEKGLSVLLVWGVEGFSHEKGDYGYAVTAAMELAKLMRTKKWANEITKEEDLNSDEMTCKAYFSIAVTMGKAWVARYIF
ncbi:Adenylate cyclase type 10 [Phlyctochytrium planicorne]|nr:Adenylate cyclase type 10 [Phlyctochytrium planicorne]